MNYKVGLDGQWAGRIIVPYYYGHKLIGWTGVDVSKRPNVQPYLKSSGNTDLLYIPGGRIPKKPLLVEGLHDAESVPNGIGTLQSKLTKKQAYFLRNANPVVIPDRKNSNLIEAAKRYGWSVCIPEWKCNDVNAAVQQYGYLITCRMIHDGVCKNVLEAEFKYEDWRIR